MNIQQLIQQISQNSDCKNYPPNFSIELPENMPSDLQEFYQLTNGIDFGVNYYGMRIIGREVFDKTHLHIFADYSTLAEGDIDYDWYIIAEDSGDEFISIDLTPNRLGRIYDTYFNSYAGIGHTPIIAYNFTEFLERMSKHTGDYPYWREDNFISYGDAYDNI